MARFQTRTEEDALRAMIARAVTRTNLSDITDTSTFKQLLRAIAFEIGEAYFQADRLRDLFGIRTAVGADLNEVAKTILLGLLERLEPRAAIGQLEFLRPTSIDPEIVPVGTTGLRADGVSYRTIEQGLAASGSPTSGPITAVATETGLIGNAGSGTVTLLSGSPGTFNQVTNPTAFVAGRATEDDDSFRERLVRYVESLSRCTVGAIEVSVIGIQNPDGSGQEVVFSHLFEDQFQPGNTCLFIDDGAGTACQRQLATPRGEAQPTGNAVLSGPVLGEMTLTDPDANFVQALISESVIITGSAVVAPTNNGGPFEINTVAIDGKSLTFTNVGQAEATSFEYQTEEVVIDPAVGGEEFLNLEQFPIDDQRPIFISTDLRGALVLGTEVFLNPSNGQLFFDPPLTVGESVFATEYTVFTGLVPEVQRAVDGDPNDRVNFPGLRAAGVRVLVRCPNVRSITVEGTLTVEDGFNRVEISQAVEQEIEFYINTLGISEDVIRNEIVERIMSVRGVIDVNLTVPPCTQAREVVDDDEIARISAGTLNVA